ncbi:MAG: hypothetical protein R2883_00160 [Caldisericia bacterium]
MPDYGFGDEEMFSSPQVQFQLSQEDQHLILPKMTDGSVKIIQKQTSNLHHTRGTCLEDGTRHPVEINLYRDVGGIKDPAVVPRNPPPKTYLTYREPSYNINDPMYNGRIIAVGCLWIPSR